MLTSRLNSRARIGLVVASTVALLLTLCWLPYKVPFPKVYSISYIFGYNNRVATLLTGCWIVLVAFLATALPLQVPQGKALTTSTLKKAVALSGLANLALYLLTRRLDGVEESIYLIDRAKLAFEGYTPYRQFEFA